MCQLVSQIVGQVIGLFVSSVISSYLLGNFTPPPRISNPPPPKNAQNKSDQKTNETIFRQPCLHYCHSRDCPIFAIYIRFWPILNDHQHAMFQYSLTECDIVTPNNKLIN